VDSSPRRRSALELQKKTEDVSHFLEASIPAKRVENASAPPANLLKHKKLRTGEKPFVCKQCGKCFSQNVNMKSHQAAVHSKEKPFKCGHCEKKFKKVRSFNMP